MTIQVVPVGGRRLLVLPTHTVTKGRLPVGEAPIIVSDTGRSLEITTVALNNPPNPTNLTGSPVSKL